MKLIYAAAAGYVVIYSVGKELANSREWPKWAPYEFEAARKATEDMRSKTVDDLAGTDILSCCLNYGEL